MASKNNSLTSTLQRFNSYTNITPPHHHTIMYQYLSYSRMLAHLSVFHPLPNFVYSPLPTYGQKAMPRSTSETLSPLYLPGPYQSRRSYVLASERSLRKLVSTAESSNTWPYSPWPAKSINSTLRCLKSKS